MKRIHPSATVFLGVLIALALPFGHAVDSCSPENADFSGVELLVQDVEGSSEEFAEETEANGAPFVDDPHAGWHLAFWLSTAGFLTRFFGAVQRRFASSVTTRREPTVR